jgi:hypothetical protein
MADTAAATGTRTQAVEFEGQTWTLVPADFGIQGRYESWLENERMQFTYRLGLTAPADAYDRLLDKAVEAIAIEKRYKWGGDLCNASLNTDEGRRKLIELCLAPYHQRVDPALVKRLFEAARREVNAALVVLNPSLFPRAQAVEGGDPKEGQAADSPASNSSSGSPTGA